MSELGVARLSVGGELLCADEVAARILDPARGEAGPAALEAARASIAAPGASAAPREFERLARGPGGPCVRAIVLPVKAPSGGLLHFELLLEERPGREGAVAGATPLLESILESLPNPVFVKDEAHRWCLVNDSLCRFTGVDRATLIGRSDYDFFPRTEADVFWAKDDEVFASGEVRENEEQFTDASGHTHTILTRKSLHTDADGRRFLLGVITDITQLKTATDELRRSRDELERRVRERTSELEAANAQLRTLDVRKDVFLGMLSHELRNPLAPMRNSAYILGRASPDSLAAARAREVIERQVSHLAHLVDDLLDVTRIARGKIELRRARLNLYEVARRAADDLRALYEEGGVELVVEVPAEVMWVDGDATRLAQVVGNLLQNAVKFTSRGGRASLSLARAGDFAELRVVDSGAGIDPALLEEIWEPFIQGEQTLARSGGGLGLGLALVKGLTELHGGKVRAHSEGRGRGAEFVVSLPLAVSGTRAEVAPRARAPGPRRRVLVVDDNRDAAESLGQLVEMFGHTSEIALDGPSAIAKARAHPPEFVLCDLGLPGMSGYDVARVFRADPGLRRSRLIAVSGYAQSEDRQRAAEAGFELHVAKPPDPEEIDRILST